MDTINSKILLKYFNFIDTNQRSPLHSIFSNISNSNIKEKSHKKNKNSIRKLSTRKLSTRKLSYYKNK
jgi:hypothetical protein